MTQPTIENSVTRLRLHRFLPRTRVEGPGLRAALWVQGCTLGCSGCLNVETWDPQAGTSHSIEEIFEWIETAPEIEGVTFVGGEPFQQAPALAELGRRCRRAGLSILTFSGYSYRHLRRARRRDWDQLLGVTDLLLAGPYRQSQRDFSRPWVGSRNQEFVFLTGRYRHLEGTLHTIPNGLEVRFDEGTVSVNGLAAEEEIRAFCDSLADLGLHCDGGS